LALYEYTGMDARGKNARGVVDADSPRAARAQLKKDGILATTLEEVRREEVEAAKSSGFSLSLGKKINLLELAMVTRQLSTLLEAGLPLVDALGSLVDETDVEKTRLVLSSVRQRVNEGASFYEALSEHPKAFSEFYRNMVRAGEAGGTLELVLDRLADFLESSVAFRRKVRSAMSYPILMAVVAVAVLVLLLGKVVPQVTGVFDNLGRELPATTKMLLAVSDVVQHYWVFVMVVVAVLGYALMRFEKSEVGRRVIHTYVLRVPRLGNFVRLAALSRFAKTLGTLIAAGVGLLEALAIAKPVIGNAVIERAVDETVDDVREGKSLSQAMRDTGQFPSEIRRMVSVGEESGQLDSMLLRVAQSYEDRLDALVVSLTSLLEPLMILVMGGVVGFVVYSILRPIFDLTEAIR